MGIFALAEQIGAVAVGDRLTGALLELRSLDARVYLSHLADRPGDASDQLLVLRNVRLWHGGR
jgi:hypothetical protein